MNTATQLSNIMNSSSQTCGMTYNVFLEHSAGKNHFTIPFWQDFCKKIEEYGQIEKFIKLVEAIATGKLSPTNLAWKCALDMGMLSMCTSTTNMRYDKDCVEFFSLFNLMFGASAINVLRGTAHFSSIVEDTSEKRKI